MGGEGAVKMELLRENIMTTTVVLASYNVGKVAEFNRAVEQLSIHFVSLTELGIPDIEETGKSFVENAILKARHAAQHCDKPVLADDSGVIVDALNGEPGIYSARYAGEEKNMSANIEKVLTAMKGVPYQQRSARFHCSLAFMRHAEDEAVAIFQGDWLGYILDAPRGDKGFGYDPIMNIPEHDCSVGELDPLIKEQESHRARALHAFFAAWPNLL